MQIDKRNRTELKTFFVKNAIPTESNFAELIDGMLNQKDDGIAKPPGNPLSIEATGDATGQRKVINFYDNFSDDNPSWSISLNPRVNPADAGSARAGFSIGDGAGAGRLFIDRATGNVGIATIAPANKLDILANPRTGSHATGRPLYVTGNLGEAEGVEFRHSNTTQGIGFGFNTIYATGSNADQHLHLRARGAGVISIPEHELHFGAKTRQMINLWRKGYAIGVQASTQYFRTDSNFAWYRGGEHRDVALDAGGGTPLMVIDGNGHIGIATNTPANRLDVLANPRTGTHATGRALYVTGTYKEDEGIEFRHSNGTQGIGFGFNTIYATGSNADQNLSLRARGAGVISISEHELHFGAKVRQMINLWRKGYGIGVQSGTHYFRSDSNFAWYRGGVHKDEAIDAGGGTAVMVIDGAGRVGINTAAPASLFDIAAKPRAGTHASGLVMYVTGEFKDDSNGVEFRHSNGTQGIGFGYNTIYATGTNENQDLTIKARGPKGLVRVNATALHTDRLNLGRRWQLSGVGERHGNDEWLRLLNEKGDYFGGLAADKLWSSAGMVMRSDSRLKEGIGRIQDAAGKLARITGVTFRWKDRDDSAPAQVGLLADEVEKVFPQLVETGPDGMKSLNYSGLIAPVIEAVKEQQAQIEQLKAEIARLRNEGPAAA